MMVHPRGGESRLNEIRWQIRKSKVGPYVDARYFFRHKNGGTLYPSDRGVRIFSGEIDAVIEFLLAAREQIEASK